MSDSDSGDIESSKKNHSKKTKYADDKHKKRKRNGSSERSNNGKNKERKKFRSNSHSEDDQEKEYKSRDKNHRKKHSEFSDDESRERKKKNSLKRKEEGSDYEKGRNRHKMTENKNKENRRDKMEKNQYQGENEKSVEKRRDSKGNDDDQNRSGPSIKYNEEKKHRKGSSRLESVENSPQNKSASKHEENEDGKKKKGKSEKSRDTGIKKTNSGRHEETGEFNERKYDSDDDRSNHDKLQRYWSPPRPKRENSDNYWNKYNDRYQNEKVEVGPRYYGSNEKVRKDRKKDERDKQRDFGGESSKHISEDKEMQNGEKEEEKIAPPKRTKTFDALTSRTGGAYIPPAKLRMMQESITDKGSAEFQRLAWEALKKSIQGHVNKVNVSNIVEIIKVIQKENIVRGKGLLCRALIQAQAASPTFTNVYAALVAVLNARFPKIGELLLKRLVVQFRRGFKRNDKTICITAATFIAHLVNQEVAHEILALEILTLLIETPTDDSVEVAIAFLKECGMKLTEVASKGVMGIFDMLRNILHEGKLEKRVQYMIEVMFQIRKEDFKAHPSLIEALDLVEQEDKITHLISLEDNHDPEDILNVFKFDPDYEANEAKYKSLVQDDEEESEGEGSGSESDDESDEDEEEEKEKKEDVIVDRTETNLVALRKTIYLTIQSSLDFEECAHKLLRMELKPGQEIEMAHMFLDCCAEQRTYEKFFGLLAQRFCQINRTYVGPFEETFRDSYATIHRMSNDKLRNVAKLFAHLLYTDAISWEVLSTIRLNEEDTTSSSRIFIKILFQELSEYMGLAKLNQRVKDPALQSALEGLFPRDNPKNTRFAINFFTSIGLGGITDELREHLKSMPRPTAVPNMVNQMINELSSGSSSSSSSSSSSDSSSDSSDSSSDSD